MKLRHSLWVGLGLLVPFAAWGETSVSWNVSIGNAPPPPVVVVREQPHYVLVPNSSVYVCDDDRIGYDQFRYGVYWYSYSNGYWYRARYWNGPFRAVEARYVPRAIWAVPANRWKHHPHGGPPGQMKKGYYSRGPQGRDVVVVEDNDDHGHGHGHGHR